MTPYTLDDADRDLRTALTLGDTEQIDRYSRLVDDLERTEHRATPPMLAAALWYANLGLRVFPLIPGQKKPFKGSNGLHDASSNPDILRGWWDRTPDANIGLATGHLVDVVDIDGPTGQQSRATHWDDIFGRIDTDGAAKVLTPRPGGMHIYVPATGDGNSAGIVPGVDYRGKGGYVVAPPSVIVAGGKDHPGTYRFLGQPRLDTLTAAAA